MPQRRCRKAKPAAVVLPGAVASGAALGAQVAFREADGWRRLFFLPFADLSVEFGHFVVLHDSPPVLVIVCLINTYAFTPQHATPQ